MLGASRMNMGGGGGRVTSFAKMTALGTIELRIKVIHTPVPTSAYLKPTTC
eukprot:COSAG05_NODE_1321_length_5191_cov_74.598586_3_plen_51_part_00